MVDGMRFILCTEKIIRNQYHKDCGASVCVNFKESQIPHNYGTTKNKSKVYNTFDEYVGQSISLMKIHYNKHINQTPEPSSKEAKYERIYSTSKS